LSFENPTFVAAAKHSDPARPYSSLRLGMLLASLPMFALYLFGQRYFVRGLTAGAVKG
jgi:raffinose/stachyose/melibiose transport system permease protein